MIAFYLQRLETLLGVIFTFDEPLRSSMMLLSIIIFKPDIVSILSPYPNSDESLIVMVTLSVLIAF